MSHGFSELEAGKNGFLIIAFLGWEFDAIIRGMSPTIHREGGFRFYFFSREESRMNVHAQCADGQAKFWLEPAVELTENYHLTDRQISSIGTLIEVHANEFRSAWIKHFGG